MISIEGFYQPDSMYMLYQQPFMFEGWVAATDGAVAIHLPRELVDYAGDIHTLDQIFNEHPRQAGQWRANMQAILGKMGGKVWHTLSGIEIPWYIRDCPWCPRDGRECYECTDGIQTLTKAVRVGSALFQARYLDLLSNLPGFRISPPGPQLPAPFLFDGGHGVLASMMEKA